MANLLLLLTLLFFFFYPSLCLCLFVCLRLSPLFVSAPPPSFQSDTHVLEFTDFGKKFITSNKMSPDSFVQMSMILAYYKLYGEFVCAYEPVLMKKYKHGRTEAMRSATAKAKVFVETWCSKFRDKKEKVQALKDAVDDHSKLVKLAASGEGVDR